MEGTTFEPSVRGGTINVSKNGQDRGCLPRYRTFVFASLQGESTNHRFRRQFHAANSEPAPRLRTRRPYA
jgi:hypothetical protein